jgi:signal transduction histidine kinase
MVTGMLVGTVAPYNDGMTEGRIAGALVALVACLAASLGIQYVLISRSYALERRDFSFTARQEAAAAFYALDHDKRALAKLASDVLGGALAASNRDEIARRVRAALSPYAGFERALAERFRAKGIDTRFTSAVTLGKLSFRDGARADVAVELGSPGAGVLLYGNREAVDGGELNSSFHYMGDGYYASINLYLAYPRLQSYLVGRMKGLLAVSAAAALGFILAVAFVLHTIVAQRKLSEMKTDFINTITHELNTPISTIAVAAENLRHQSAGADDAERLRLAGVILRQDKRLQRMVENVTRLSLLERDDLALAEEPVPLHVWLAAIVGDFRTRWEGQAVAVAEHYHARDDMASIDPALLASVVVNLLDNAVKHGGREVEISVSTAGHAGVILIEVEDNGPGIAPEERSRIFDKFYRAGRGRGHGTSGLGIGLYTARRIVEAHGGTIAVTDRSAGGSVFTVSLPVGEGARG